MYKKMLAFLLAILCIMSTAVIGVSAADTEPATNLIYFRVPDSWENYYRIFCHISVHDTYKSLTNWQSKKESCTQIEGNLWAYDLSKAGDIKNDIQYTVIFSSNTGMETYELMFTSECIGDIVYCDGTMYFSHHYSRGAYVAFWENKAPEEAGPVIRISQNGDVTGICKSQNNAVYEEMFADFLSHDLTYAQKHSAKSDQQLIDDIITKLGISAEKADMIIKSVGVKSLEWGKGYGDATTEPLYSWEYRVENGKVILTKYSTKESIIDIPDTIDGMPVVGIDCDTFFKYTFIDDKIVNIPASVTNISIPVCNDFNTITAINVHKDNPVYCSVDGVIYSKDKKALIMYPGKKADKVCTVDESTTTICENAFFGSRIQKIILPDTLETISDGAFARCHILKEINIPASVTHISGNSFVTNYNLTDVNVAVDNKSYSSIDGILFNKDQTSIIYYPYNKGYTSYTVPETVIQIEDKAFMSSSKLDKVILPENLESIGYKAFFGCRAEDIKIPPNVSFIGEEAFSNSGITEAIVPEGVTMLRNRTFYNIDISKASLPYGITYIGKEAFAWNRNMEIVNIPETVTAIDTSAFQGCSSIDEITIPPSVTKIGENAFADCSKDLVIYGYEGSVAENCAAQYNYKFVAINGNYSYQDNDTGVTIITQNEWDFDVEKATETRSFVTIDVSGIYNIDVEGNAPEGVITIKLPTTNNEVAVYKTDTDGTLTKITSVCKDGYLIVLTEELGRYIVATAKYATGDTNLDKNINVRDATAIQKHLASIETFNDETAILADYDADGKITIKDATSIQKFVAGIL